MIYQNLIAEMEKSAAKVAKLQAELAEEQARGQELFKEFQRNTSELGKQFGLVGEDVVARRGRPRGERSILSRVLTSVTRAINGSSSADMALDQAVSAAEGVMLKKGYKLNEAETLELHETIQDRIVSAFGEAPKGKGKKK